MRLLTVPNWSFGRDTELLRRCKSILDSAPRLEVHYAAGDIDHNRTVTAFTGDSNIVFETLLALADTILQRIDLNRHVGVHPRIGALDVCPFVIYEQEDLDWAKVEVQHFAHQFAETFEVPVFLYEQSEQGRHESDLPTLRKGGFGGLHNKVLNPDYGPPTAHPRWGVTIMGVRSFLIAMNVNLRTTDVAIAKSIAREIRNLRSEGDERFLGVRALGFPLASQQLSQVSLNLTLPDITPVDPIIEWIEHRAYKAGILVENSELIGVIRQKDLSKSSKLPIDPRQVVEMVEL